MGFRLSKIYTRTGDDGTTGLASGERLKKDHIRIEAMGNIDELNSSLGVFISLNQNQPINQVLQQVQNHLFDIGGELALPSHTTLDSEHIRFLETQLDNLNDSLEPLKEFILPGGGTPSAWAHFARTQCRQAERRLVSLNSVEQIRAEVLSYINRLSDLLFVIARSCNKHDQIEDVLWQRQQP